MNEQHSSRRQERRQRYLKRLKEWQAKPEKKPGTLSDIARFATWIGLLSDDPSQARAYFHLAAQTKKELFQLAWEHQDSPDYDGYYGYGAVTTSVAAIDGIHAALAAGDLELAKDIASRSGFKPDGIWIKGKEARIFADALRSLVLKGDLSGFAAVPPKEGPIGYSDLANIYLMGTSDREKALAALGEYEKFLNTSPVKSDYTFQLAIPAIRNWLNQN
jgi:hypothetical protein